MKIQDCLTADIAVIRPPIRNKPEDEWEKSYKNKWIPETLYRFYCLANYFSFDKIPPFLKEENGKLFFYLASLTRSIRESLDESYELLEEIKKHHKNAYSPFKEIKKQEYDPKARILQGRCLKYLLVTLASSLDQLAEIMALFFPGEIKQLYLGRSKFSSIITWSNTKLLKQKGIVMPQQHYLEKLHKIFNDKLKSTGPETDWFELFLLYRNKIGHLGDAMFPKYCLHDNKGEFFTFTPKQWPINIEEGFEQPSIKQKSNFIQKYFDEILMQQDITEYTELLVEKIKELLHSCFEIFCEIYKDFKDFEPNKKSLESLKERSEKYKFCYFTR